MPVWKKSIPGFWSPSGRVSGASGVGHSIACIISWVCLPVDGKVWPASGIGLEIYSPKSNFKFSFSVVLKISNLNNYTNPNFHAYQILYLEFCTQLRGRVDLSARTNQSCLESSRPPADSSASKSSALITSALLKQQSTTVFSVGAAHIYEIVFLHPRLIYKMKSFKYEL